MGREKTGKGGKGQDKKQGEEGKGLAERRARKGRRRHFAFLGANNVRPFTLSWRSVNLAGKSGTSSGWRLAKALRKYKNVCQQAMILMPHIYPHASPRDSLESQASSQVLLSCNYSSARTPRGYPIHPLWELLGQDNEVSAKNAQEGML